MTIWGIVLMIIFFPLNSFLLFQESLVGGKKVQADIAVGEKNLQDPVEDISENKSEETKQIKAQAVDDPEYKPVRKDSANDLAIPNAHASIVIDADSGTILHYSGGRDKRQIASLTKIMTAVLVLENVKNLDEEITIDGEAVNVEGTKIGCPRSGYCISQRLKIGEKITVRNLLQAMLMNSANDAAVALAKHVSGTQESFVKIMNKKAEELGMSDTNFCTPSGLEIDGRESECYSSAYDIARIAAYSLRYDTIWDMFRLASNSTITSADQKISHTIINTDLALGLIPNVIGGKTGFTPLAGYSLLMAVADPNETKHRIVAVVLDDITRWKDIRTMIDWTFNSFEWKYATDK